MVFYLTLAHYALAIRPIGLIGPIRPTYTTRPPTSSLPTRLPASSTRPTHLSASPPCQPRPSTRTTSLAPQMRVAPPSTAVEDGATIVYLGGD